MEKNYNFNFEQREVRQVSDISFSNVGVTECKKSVLNGKLKSISNGKLYHTIDTNEFFYDWNGKRYKLDLFGSAGAIEAAQAAASKASAAAAKADKVAKEAEKVASDVKSLMSGVKTIKSFSKTSSGYDLILSDGSKLSLLNGAKGAKGDKGETGATGAKGQKGDKGETGATGADGADGKSAFDIAKELNPELTDEAEWIASLKGADGKDGKDGEDGTPGINGNDGADGKSAYELWKEISGNEEKTIDEFFESLKGEDGEGLTDEDKAKIDSIPDDLSTGSFPEESNWEDSDAASDGFATVQDVMDYVNLMLEKKKIDGDSASYIYISGYPIDGTATPIYQMNCYEIDDDAIANGIEVRSSKEILGYDGGPDDDGTTFTTIFAIDVPEGYSIEVHNWDSLAGNYSAAVNEMVENPRYATKKYGSVDYNCYVRYYVDAYEDARGANRYKILITKN